MYFEKLVFNMYNVIYIRNFVEFKLKLGDLQAKRYKYYLSSKKYRSMM